MTLEDWAVTMQLIGGAYDVGWSVGFMLLLVLVAGWLAVNLALAVIYEQVCPPLLTPPAHPLLNHPVVTCRHRRAGARRPRQRASCACLASAPHAPPPPLHRCTCTMCASAG